MSDTLHVETADNKTVVKLRLDVDYAFPSRNKGFVYTALGIKSGKDYLKNSKVIARMVNESPRQVKAYWFFTPYTIPDEELLHLLNAQRHEVSLHVANNPYKEWKHLEEAAHRKIDYYTVHGTARLSARLIWKRKPWQDRAPIPKDFPLQSFYRFPTLALDWLCYAKGTVEAVRIARESIAEGKVLHVHPGWLFQKGTLNHRGPYYEALRTILEVDKELENLVVQKKVFVKIVSDRKEYEKNATPTKKFIAKLRERGMDIFTFIERKWSNMIPNPPHNWAKTEDNIALLKVATYDEWWKNIGKKTRNMVRKAEKSGVKTEVVGPSEKLAEGIWKIYNETPIRQERAFPHYGIQLQSVIGIISSTQNCTYLGGYLQEELIGFIQLIYENNEARISQILALQKHLDKAVNNALVAKAVEFCANKKIKWLMYGRMGNHPSLDKFKQSNGFSKFPLTRYYVPITGKGRIAVKMGLHREIKDALPQSIKYRLIPFYNWVSRSKMRIKLRLSS